MSLTDISNKLPKRCIYSLSINSL